MKEYTYMCPNCGHNYDGIYCNNCGFNPSENYIDENGLWRNPITKKSKN